MVTGEKQVEVRNATRYWTTRLTDRETGKLRSYQYVTFTRGYGRNAPRFTAECRGVFKAYKFDRTYSTGFSWTLPHSNAGYFIILLGPIVARLNTVAGENIAST